MSKCQFRKDVSKILATRSSGLYLTVNSNHSTTLQDQRVSLAGRHWHTRGSCFKCGVCGLGLVGGKLLLRAGLPLCSSQCAAALAANQGAGAGSRDHLPTNPRPALSPPPRPGSRSSRSSSSSGGSSGGGGGGGYEPVPPRLSRNGGSVGGYDPGPPRPKPPPPSILSYGTIV